MYWHKDQEKSIELEREYSSEVLAFCAGCHNPSNVWPPKQGGREAMGSVREELKVYTLGGSCHIPLFWFAAFPFSFWTHSLFAGIQLAQ